MKQLLASGVDPNSHDSQRNTALIYAARDGHVEMVEILIAAGADVNWLDREVVSPLILSAHKNRPEVVKRLMAAGASRTVVDQWGRTAMDYARRRGAADPIVRLLTQ